MLDEILDKILAKYQEMTGKVIPPLQQPMYKAWARRALAGLETKLGWSLAPTHEVVVAGVAKDGCACTGSTTDLDPSPEAVGSYAFFPFNTKQPFVMTNPFIKVHNVYVARVAKDQTSDVIILKGVNPYSPRYLNDTFGKYLEACQPMTICQEACEKGCTKCAVILVDADWMNIDDLPDELWYLLFDYINWLSAGGIENRGLKSEAVDGHSVSYATEWQVTDPYAHPANADIIALYMGPYGGVSKKLIW